MGGRSEAGAYAATDGLAPQCGTEIAGIGRTGQPAIAVRLTAGIIAQRGDGLRPGPSLKGEMLPVEAGS